MKAGRLPDLFVVGAARCGTTSLHFALAEHPYIYMSAIKEPNYFAHDKAVLDLRHPDNSMISRKSIFTQQEYLQLFEAAPEYVKYVGESSPLYLPSPGAARRIKDFSPDAKIICLLRNPVDRAISHFTRFLQIEGYRPGEISPILSRGVPTHLSDWWDYFVRLGMYSHQLKRYLLQFTEDSVYVGFYDVLAQKPEVLSRQLAEFLELETQLVLHPSRALNRSGSASPLSRLLAAVPDIAKRMLRELAPSEVYRRLVFLRHTFEDRFGSDNVQDLIPQSWRGNLLEVYYRDIEELEELLGCNLSRWLKVTQE